MTVRYIENSVVAQTGYDKEAAEVMREVVKGERQADMAASLESKKKYWDKAQ